MNDKHRHSRRNHLPQIGKKFIRIVFEYIFIPAAIAVLFVGVSMVLEGHGQARLAGIIITAAIVVPAILYRWVERKRLKITLRELEKLIKPVVYLRSFGSEESEANFLARLWIGWTGRPIYGSGNFPFREVEQDYFAELMKQIGPYVALGRPGEKLPFPGAKKVYVPDEIWKKTVKQLVDRAGAVVLEIGGSGGLLWEIEYLTKNIGPTKLLVILPASYKKYPEIVALSKKYFPEPFPEKIDKNVRLIMFSVDWKPVPITTLFLFLKQNGVENPKVVADGHGL